MGDALRLFAVICVVAVLFLPNAVAQSPQRVILDTDPGASVRRGRGASNYPFERATNRIASA